MDDMASQNSELTAAKTSAPKDKNCPFCGQAFTSSSLGRHLDLYIKEKNPKPADGVHDVVAIRKLRGAITRRQPRGSIGAQKDGMPSKRPRFSTKRETASRDNESMIGKPTSNNRNGGGLAVDSASSKYPFLSRCETTGVLSGVSAKGPRMPRNASKQALQKYQLEVNKKLADAMDTARAAELALRELLGSWRAAKQHVGNHSMPFDFDPLALDFPALTLRCLQPPPTLFSSTQYPASTSWSVQSPGKREFGALQVFFEQGFRAWTRASTTASPGEERTYKSCSSLQIDSCEAMKGAEKAAKDLESLVERHLQSAFAVWDSLPMQRQQDIWILELARGVGRKHTEMEKMKEQQHRLEQENAQLKMQIEQLNRVRQPGEPKLPSPTTVPTEEEFISRAYEQGVTDGQGVGFDITDRQVDVSTLVTRSIERWKSVMMATRATSDGMAAQISLDQSMEFSTSHDSLSRGQWQSVNVSRGVQPQQSQKQQNRRHRQPSVSQHSNSTGDLMAQASTTRLASEHTTSSTSTPGPLSVEEDMSDQDADAEMDDDDSFAMMNASSIKHPHAVLQQSGGLDASRTQALLQQPVSAPDMRFMMQNGTGSPIGQSTMGMTRSMPNMNIVMQGSHMQGGDMSLMQQVRGDALYMNNGM